MNSTGEILTRWQHLQDSGLDLGAQLGPEQSSLSGGLFQEYERGRVYWHEELGTYEIRGDFYTKWMEEGAELSEWGYPVTAPVEVVGGEAVYFERGCMWKGPASADAIIDCRLHPPLLGRPLVVNPDNPQQLRLPAMLRWHLSDEMREAIDEEEPDLYLRLWEGLVLQRVTRRGERGEEVPLVAGGMLYLAGGPIYASAFAGSDTDGRRGGGGAQAQEQGTGLQDRGLYNVALKLPGGKTFVLAPHAVYARKSWDNFGLIHATDIHISRRLDYFKPKLRELGFHDGAERCNNNNDSLREMIRYANRLYDLGLVDAVIATGDLADYMYEKDDYRDGGGNFAFFEQIIRGKAPSPEGLENEELLVPVFTTLGNHDYRPNYFDLVVDLDLGDVGGIDWFPDWLWSPKNSKDIVGFYSLNLTMEEAKAIQGGENPCLDKDSAYAMVKVEAEKLEAYHNRRIGNRASYILRLGKHRIVMLDSRWELGIVEGTFEEYIKIAAGRFNEDAKNWLSQHPNCVGFDDEHLALVRKAVEEAGEDGLVIVGVHAPPINPVGDEYAHYFRETEHPTAPEGEVEAFLMRRDPKAFAPANRRAAPPDPSRLYTDWTRTGTPYFKTGGIGDMMDYGIARGKTEEFLQVCVGVDAARQVDLVLCGHIHSNVEYRLRWDPQQQFLFFMDFYTENPQVYYSTLNNFEMSTAKGKLRKGDPIHIEVKEGVELHAQPAVLKDGHGHVAVPPYATPLNSTGSPREWWEEHRPMIMQTASLGSIDRNQREEMPNASFQGFRVITVQENAISKIRHVTLKELRERQFSLPWESDAGVNATPQEQTETAAAGA